MYPGELLNLFPPYPRTNMVFVAMSFDDEFKHIWEEVIKPSVSKARFKEEQLFAHRVDIETKSDSIITEIVKNISECRLFLADVSTVGNIPIDPENGNPDSKPVRSANVFYEVGIAHACRLPEEVILLRSDKDTLDFDIANVRVHKYDPSNKEKAIEDIKNLINGSLKSIDDRKQIAVELAVQKLDPMMFNLLHVATLKNIPHPPFEELAHALSNAQRIDAINRLLGSGMFKTIFKEFTPDTFEGPLNEFASYIATPFGTSVYMKARELTNFNKAFIAFNSQKGIVKLTDLRA